MKHTSSLKSLDMTELISNKSNPRRDYSKIINSKTKLPTQINNQDEESVLSHSSRSLIAKNRENSNHTHQKYLKMLDPSFLNDGDSISISNNGNYNNTHVPQKILKLLPLEKNGMSLKNFSSKKFNLKELSQKFLSQNDFESIDQIDKSHSKIIKNNLKNEELYSMLYFYSFVFFV